MLLVLIALGFSLSYFSESIKGIDYYSLQVESPSIEYELSPNKGGTDLKYRPNVHSFSAISIGNNKGSITLTSQNNDEDKEDFGASKVFDLQLIGHKDSYLWEVFYQNYQGLYITEEDIAENLPSANSWSYGLSLKHFFSEGFKLKTSFRNLTPQKSSDWSWIRGIYINKNKIFSSEGLIPTEYNNQFTQLQGLSGIETTNLGVDFGVGGTYVWNNFFTTAMLTVGYQIQEQIYDGISDKKRTITQHSTHSLLGIGYDINLNHSFGLELRSSSLNIPLKNVEYIQTRGIFSIYYKYFF